MTRLEQLGQLHGTDKVGHGYLPFYSDTLPKLPRRVLEIGCYQGASARMWREYFGPETEVHVLDLFIENPIPDVLGVIFHTGDATHPETLNRLRNYNFDVIIDDGSHNSRDQMITFFGLFNDKCHYYIEDIHCNLEPFYSQGLPLAATASKFFQGRGEYHGGITSIISTNIILISNNPVALAPYNYAEPNY